MTVVLGKWDKGLDFITTKAMLYSVVDNLGKMLMPLLPNKSISLGKKFIYNSIAVIQLMNGARAGEAVEMLKVYASTGKTSFEITSEKTKLPRPAKIPNIVSKYKVLYNVYNDIIQATKKKAYIDYLKRTYGWNSHSLRYAFIKYLIDKGYTAEQIAIITAHKRINTTLDYARKVNADKILEQIQNE